MWNEEKFYEFWGDEKRLMMGSVWGVDDVESCEFKKFENLKKNKFEI